MSRRRVESWCFTLNNWTQEEFESIKTCIEEYCDFAVIGRETGQQGTPHLQGCLHLKTKRTFTALRSLFDNSRIHWEATRKTREDNYKYCTKEDTEPYVWGEVPDKLRGVVPIRQALTSGIRLRTVAKEVATLQDLKIAEAFSRYSFNQDLFLDREVHWCYGPTGTGKTRFAYEFCINEGLDFWMSGANLKWFDGYSGQEVAIIDDFRASKMEFCDLLRLTDIYPYTVEVKGAVVDWCPKYIFVTCPVSPRVMYADSSEDITQLLRRITRVHRFGGLHEPMVEPFEQAHQPEPEQLDQLERFFGNLEEEVKERFD